LGPLPLPQLRGVRVTAGPDLIQVSRRHLQSSAPVARLGRNHRVLDSSWCVERFAPSGPTERSAATGRARLTDRQVELPLHAAGGTREVDRHEVLPTTAGAVPLVGRREELACVGRFTQEAHTPHSGVQFPRLGSHVHLLLIGRVRPHLEMPRRGAALPVHRHGRSGPATSTTCT
jgi:hypothetical protein